MPNRPESVRSRAFRITVDEGRETFFALSIEQEDSDEAWLISDTVQSLVGNR